MDTTTTQYRCNHKLTPAKNVVVQLTFTVFNAQLQNTSAKNGCKTRTHHDRHINRTAWKINTGADTNVMPLHIYKMISEDYDVKHLKCSSFEMTTYDGTNMVSLGIPQYTSDIMESITK